MSALETYVIITIQEMQTGLIKHLVRALVTVECKQLARSTQTLHNVFVFVRLKWNLRCAKCNLSYYY